jgi:hypothetical protein
MKKRKFGASTVAGGGGGGGGAATPEVMVQIIDGNTLTSGAPGIKWINTYAGAISGNDISGSGTLPDGLGRVWVWEDGVQQLEGDPPTPKKSLLVNDSRGVVYQALVAGEWVRVDPTKIKLGGTGDPAYRTIGY